MDNNNKLYIIGISHKSSSIEDREIFQLNRKDIPQCLKFIKNNDTVEGVIIITTCNRLEFVLVLNSDAKPESIIFKFYEEYKNIKISDKKFIFYCLEGIEATRHLFNVISGLDSLVLGEYQIQNQVKEAYSLACEAKTVEKILHKLLHAAFRCGKSVRSNTEIGKGKLSVSGVASQLIFDNIEKNEKISIIGVNENTKIFANELKKAGYHNFIFINRTFYKAEMMCEEFGGKAAGLDQLEKSLFESNAVFSCTGAPGIIVSSEMLLRLYTQERCPRLLIDMAVPRDINTTGLPSNIKKYNISELKSYLDQQEKQRQEDVPAAIKIIEDEVRLFKEWSENSSNDILQPYAEKFELTRQQLLEEVKEQFSEKSFEKVDKVTRQLMHRLQSTFVRALVKQNEDKQ